jgi:S-adenosylmethionine-dependent methyltransferase
MNNSVEKFYDKNARAELIRLDKYILEWDMTNKIIEDYIKSPVSILDLGGGPGKYSIHLSKKGHKVTLADISNKNLELARKNALKANVVIRGFFHVNATDLSCFNDSSFDAILCLGPLYHLPKPADRIKAMNEAIRVLRINGFLFVSFISSFGPILDCLRYHPETILDRKSYLLEKFMDGKRLERKPGKGFADAYYHHPFEIEPFMSQFKLKKEKITAVEGLFSQSLERLKKFEKNLYLQWLDFSYKLLEDPATWGATDHLMYVGRKI